MRKEVGYLCEPCEFVTLELIEAIETARKEYKVVGLGVASDQFFEALNHRQPIKPYEERYRLGASLKGVDFVFQLTAENLLGIKEAEVPSFINDIASVEKKYHVAYAPGTYDLFHEGHMQHLLEARSLCDILIAGVNSDKLVWENKKKKTIMPEEARMTVLRNLKFVDQVYLVEGNSKRTANEWAKSTIGVPIDAIFMGSDLKGDDHEENPDGIPIVYTERNPIIMAKRSSTYYREQLEKLQQS